MASGFVLVLTFAAVSVRLQQSLSRTVLVEPALELGMRPLGILDVALSRGFEASDESLQVVRRADHDCGLHNSRVQTSPFYHHHQRIPSPLRRNGYGEAWPLGRPLTRTCEFASPLAGA